MRVSFDGNYGSYGKNGKYEPGITPNLLSVIPSKLIYDAVLQGRAEDVESFRRLMEESGIAWH